MTFWSHNQLEVVWQFQKFISPFSQDLWPQNLAGCWLWGGGWIHKRLNCHWLLVIVIGVVFLFKNGSLVYKKQTENIVGRTISDRRK